ncbi:hypothetical protein KA344_21700, partial [bacterium]|nr:hypothetical protein [bacterium]
MRLAQLLEKPPHDNASADLTMSQPRPKKIFIEYQSQLNQLREINQWSRNQPLHIGHFLSPRAIAKGSL